MLQGLFCLEGDETMPFKPKVSCKHPGCVALIPSGTKYCEVHRPLHPEEIRSTYKRGYDARWRKVSKAFLRANPLCVRCMKEGKYVKATVVDHVIPHRGDERLFWDQGNWQALCKQCHDRKTRREDQKPEYHDARVKSPIPRCACT